jgi:hypothetical protein
MLSTTLRFCALASTALAMGALPLTPARAQTTTSINGIESEIKALQRELQELKRQMQAKEAAVRAARQDAQAAKESAAAAQAAAQARPAAPAAPPPGYLITTAPTGPVANILGTASGSAPPGGPAGQPEETKGTFHLAGVTVTLNGFVAGEGAYRNKNQAGDLPSSFSAIPFAQTPVGHESQTVFSGRQSRIGLLAFGDPTPDTRISAYYESDFLGGSSNGNNNESNSYVLRVRQAFASVDYADRADDLGLHFLAGQAWSLVTPGTSGILPRKENVPLTIDPQYVVGYTWARQAQFRATADLLDHRLWVAVSAESPQTTFTTGGLSAASGYPGTANGLALPVGGDVTVNNPGTSPDYSGNNFSINGVPDFVLKVAADPGFGHYEALGLVRVMSDRVDSVGHGSNNNSLGGGVGANADIRVFKWLDVLGNVLVGDGIGRYGSGQLSDATIKPNGTVSPIPEVEAMVGLVGHPVPSLDIYGYAGTEQESKTAFTYAGKGYGLGSPLFVNTGCGTELSTATCTGNTQALYEGVLGAWWRPYKGDYGTLQTGVQYSHVLREAFEGVGGKPKSNEDALFVSFRYYPFQ